MICRADRPLDVDQQALALEYLRWAEGVAINFANRYPSLADEMESAALVGLCEAARGFDPESGVRFKTFALPRIRGAMGDVLRLWTPKGYQRKFQRKGEEIPTVREASRLASYETESGRLVSEWDHVESGELPIGWEAESEDEVRRMTRDLFTNQRDVMLLAFLDAGASSACEAASKLGVGPSWIWHLRREAIKALKGNAEAIPQ